MLFNFLTWTFFSDLLNCAILAHLEQLLRQAMHIQLCACQLLVFKSAQLPVFGDQRRLACRLSRLMYHHHHHTNCHPVV